MGACNRFAGWQLHMLNFENGNFMMGMPTLVAGGKKGYIIKSLSIIFIGMGGFWS